MLLLRSRTVKLISKNMNNTPMKSENQITTVLMVIHLSFIHHPFIDINLTMLNRSNNMNIQAENFRHFPLPSVYTHVQ